MQTKYYAVKTGRKPGVYKSWAECQAQVNGYSGATYQKFDSLAAAKTFIGTQKKKKTSTTKLEEPFAYVDGSFITLEGDNVPIYGFGGFVQYNSKPHYFKGCGDDKNLVKMRNVAGEIIAAMTAVKIAEGARLKQLTIVYDYAGIEEWAMGNWKTNTPGTQYYARFMTQARQRIKLEFVKVKGHTGVQGNEIADALAKSSVGYPIEKKYEGIVKSAELIEPSND